MKRWSERPPEVAHLFNPAFCALLLREAVRGFAEVSPSGMPHPLVFLLLPIVLHKATRESLPGSITTKMHPWLQEHQGSPGLVSVNAARLSCRIPVKPFSLP